MRFRKSLQVGLAVGCHGHLLELQVSRRYHVLGEALADFGLHLGDVDGTVGGEVGAEVLLAGKLADHDDHVLHAFHAGNDVLHLAEFDAKTAEFDLMVLTAEDEHVAVGCPLGIVA